MADYFLVLDGTAYESEIRPALAASWRTRSFEPCRGLCERLAPAAREFARRYHSATEEPLVCEAGLEFDRATWRALAGEVFLFAAVEMPEFPTDLETLVCLLAPDAYRRPAGGEIDRLTLAPVEQALRGSRDVTLGPAVYRPLDAGLNDRADVARLAENLQGVCPETWTVDDLRDLRDLRGAGEDGDLVDELEFAREWFPVLADLYRRTARDGRVVVLERTY